jgi:rod shape-determining protein MreC
LSGEWLSQQAKSEDQLRRENTAMQAELLQSRVRLQKLAELSAENTRLRGLLNTPLIIDGRMLIAEIIGTDTDPLRHILVINRGRQDRVFVGQVVLDDHGVMGQVLEVFAHSSRVLLLSDKQHSASVRIERTGMRGILSGTGDSGQVMVQYVPNTADIQKGDRLMTSGLGQRFPAGYPIAIVTDIKRHGSGEFAEVSAKPLAQLEGGHHVLLLFSVPLAGEQPYATP